MSALQRHVRARHRLLSDERGGVNDSGMTHAVTNSRHRSSTTTSQPTRLGWAGRSADVIQLGLDLLLRVVRHR
jgi:tetrahydromethanopterin S-methyltransferase subunit H